MSKAWGTNFIVAKDLSVRSWLVGKVNTHANAHTPTRWQKLAQHGTHRTISAGENHLRLQSKNQVHALRCVCTCYHARKCLGGSFAQSRTAWIPTIKTGMLTAFHCPRNENILDFLEAVKVSAIIIQPGVCKRMDFVKSSCFFAQYMHLICLVVVEDVHRTKLCYLCYTDGASSCRPLQLVGICRESEHSYKCSKSYKMREHNLTQIARLLQVKKIYKKLQSKPHACVSSS